MERETSLMPVEKKGSFKEELQWRAGTIGLFLAVIWAVWLTDTLLFGGRLAKHGVIPRSARGLPGILWAPFLHVGWSHVTHNSLGILFLGGLIIMRDDLHFWTVSILGALVAGGGTWLIGRGGTAHIGASGVIFACFGYLLFTGIFERRIGSLLLSILKFFVWGGYLWLMLPTRTAISCEGHVCGFIGGVIAAKLLAGKSGKGQNLQSGKRKAVHRRVSGPYGSRDGVWVAFQQTLSCARASELCA